MAEDEKCAQRVPKKLRSPLHPGLAADAKLLIKLVKEYIPITRDTRLLEVGCGWGVFTFHLDRECKVLGIDTSPALLQRNPIDKTLLMDVQDLQFEGGTFDVVFAHDTLHHIPDPDKAIREMARVSKRHVVIVEPNILNLANAILSVANKEERKAHRFTVRGLERLVARNGLRIIHMRRYGTLVPFLTPRFLVPLQRALSFDQPFGLEHLVIAERVLTD
ncbi:MAG: class I SAM-dependent methyltransferase [Chloroflexota bacterium]